MRYAVYVVMIVALLVLAGSASAEQIVVQMNLISDQGVGASIGTVTLTDLPSYKKGISFHANALSFISRPNTSL